MLILPRVLRGALVSQKGEPVYEVWLDGAHFVERFHYPDTKARYESPKVAPGHFRFARHCHAVLGVLPALPYTWTHYGPAYYSAARLWILYPRACVWRFDGVKRRPVRMVAPRYSPGHGEKSTREDGG